MAVETDPSPTADEQHGAALVIEESDFSVRKLRVAGICLLGQLFGTSMLIVGPLAMLMLPMTKEFGWSRSRFSYSTTLIMWTSALASPLLGRLIDRRGVRPVVLTGTTVMGVLVLAMAYQSGRLWQFYLLFALVGIFGAVAGGYGKVMGSLFVRHRGKAMATVAAFSPIIASVFPQVSNQALLAWGWRGIFTTYGTATLAVTVLLYFFLEEPAGVTDLPATKPTVKRAELKTSAPLNQLEGSTTAQALRSRSLWTLLGTVLLGGLLGSGWNQHNFAFQLSRGFSQQLVVNALSASLLIAPFATMFGGWLMDRAQTPRIYLPFAFTAALSVYLQSVMWPNHGGAPLLFTAITLSSVALNVQLPMFSYFLTRFFGMKAFAEIFGIYMAVRYLVLGLSAPLVGMMYEHSGSYNLTLLGMIGGYALSGLLFLAIGRYRYTTNFKANTCR